MPRSMMCLRIARVLSANLALASHVSIAVPNVLMTTTRRFSRCFSSAGDMPLRALVQTGGEAETSPIYKDTLFI
ncbi:UNVERIFIED_ORG: hypothetical protein J2Y81_006049 [Paraburkholderia sediminicola]|nr:hypothetical protein [Paraburkholderia sediminicola]